MTYYYAPCELMTYDLTYSSENGINYIWHHFGDMWERYYGKIPDEFNKIPDSAILLLGVFK